MFGLYYEDSIFKKWSKKMYILGNTALYNKELNKMGFSATPMLVCIFV